MKPAEAWKIMRTVDEFKNGKYGQEDKKQRDNFSSRLSALRDQLECKDTRANSDADALAHDRALFLAPATDNLGVPRWEGSESQRLLKADIEAGVHLTFQTLKTLWHSREQYFEIHTDSTRFIKRIHQEIKTRKFRAQYPRLPWANFGKPRNDGEVASK
jgi:hypothetical protein